jgi:hypothetical protein
VSWDVDLIDEVNGGALIDQNYTHNTSVMIYAVLADAGLDLGTYTGPTGETRRNSWWAHLNGMPGPVGAAYLNLIIRGLEADPERFRAMNPSNGWGNYDDLVKILTDLRNAVPEWPTRWEASG